MAVRSRLHRGVLLLPSLFTLGNLFCGLFALRATTDLRLHGTGNLEHAALFIFVAILLDGVDGKIARLAHATSPLGMQLDSLADVVSFGVAPGLLAYGWALDGLEGNLGWALVLLFTACGAIRLARFNVQAGAAADDRFFVGLPIPAAAGAIASVVYLNPEPIEGTMGRLAVAGMAVALSLLMVSTVRYHSFKQVDTGRRQPVRVLLWIVLVFAVLSSNPKEALASAVLLYVLSGPFSRVVGGIRSANRRNAGAAREADKQEDSSDDSRTVSPRDR